MAKKPIDPDQDFDDSPQGWARLWTVEMDAAESYIRKFREAGKKAWKRFIDERDSKMNGERKLNLYHADTVIKHATLYGNTPQVQVERRFADAQDDDARVGAEILERILNSDIERDSDTAAEAIDNACWDWLVPGMGQARQRYVADFEDVEDENGELIPDQETGEPVQKVSREDVECDYVPWDKWIYSPARVWRDVRWVAFEADMSRHQLMERFGSGIGRLVPLNAKKGAKTGDETAKAEPWDRAEEIGRAHV